jgi:hypothetical protein
LGPKGTVSQDFLIQLFSWIIFSNHLKITLGPFHFFQKFAEMFASEGAPPVSTHRWKLCHWYQHHQRKILPPVLLVLLIPVANNGNNIRLMTPSSEFEGKNLFTYMLTLLPKSVQKNNWNFSHWKYFPFATGVNNTGGAPWAANISCEFFKNFKHPKWHGQRLVETDSWKKPEVENLVVVSLYVKIFNTKLFGRQSFTCPRGRHV